MDDKDPKFQMFRVSMTYRLMDLFIEYRKNLVQERRGEVTINQSAIAAELDVHQSTIGRLFDPNHTPTFTTVAQMAKVLGLSYEAFFAQLFGSEASHKQEEDIFDVARHELSRHQLEYLERKIDTMLQAKRTLAEDPELYGVIYTDSNFDQARTAGRVIAEGRIPSQGSRKLGEKIPDKNK